ncbi:hypothetical protein Bamy01_29490 [Bacillus amyloliquefaciens]|nr:hypothetical protein Bamy01_29490 [Bacillus amyloliquefaciens]
MRKLNYFTIKLLSLPHIDAFELCPFKVENSLIDCAKFQQYNTNVSVYNDENIMNFQEDPYVFTISEKAAGRLKGTEQTDQSGPLVKRF